MKFPNFPLLSVPLAGLALSMVSQLIAEPIDLSPEGLEEPTFTINFDEFDIDDSAEVTDQFISLGASFVPNLFLRQGDNPDWQNVEGPNLRTGDPEVNPFTIRFETPMSSAAFVAIAQPPTPTTITAKLNGEEVESFETTVSIDNPDNFFGFTDIVFDEIEVEYTEDTRMRIDSLQLGAAAEAGGDPDLVAWWPLTEGSGEDLNDSISGDIAQLVDGDWIQAEDGDGVPGFLAGKSVPSFDGSATYALLGEEIIPVMDVDTPFSLAFWTNQVNSGGGVNNIVLGNRYDIDGVDFAPREFIKFTPTKFEFHQNGGGGDNVAYDEPIPDDIWTHHAIVKEGHMFTYYRNGEEITVHENSGVYPENPQPLFIGGQQPGGEHWSGSLADIGLWKRSLPDTDVAKIFAEGIASIAGSGRPDLVISFNEDEELPEGLTLDGNAAVREEGGVDGSGYLSVTDAENSQVGTVIFPDLLGGRVVKSFNFKADVRAGGGTDRPADGFSINLVRPDDKVLSGGGFNVVPEEGTETGLSIGFDEYDSGNGEKVGFSVHVDGEVVTEVEAAVLNGEADDPESLQTGPLGPDGNGDGSLLTWQPFEVSLDETGKVSISWKGNEVLSGFQTTFVPRPVRIVFGGRTGGANSNHHVDNLELSIDSLRVLAVAKITASTSGLSFEVRNTEESVIDKTSIALTVDGEVVTPTVTDVEGGVLIAFEPAEAWLPASTHTYELTANDMNGLPAVRSGAGESTLEDTAMPFRTPLVGPEGEEGLWGVRYVWGSALPDINTNAVALEILQRSDADDFEGFVYDTTAAVANHGAARDFFPDALPYPEEAEFGDDGEWDGNDFIVSYKGTLRITDPGVYSFGVNSDDGMGLRIWGAEFIESGGGQIDLIAPDTLFFPTPTGNSDTHGTVNLAAGTYPIEFFWWERGGGDKGVLYFAKGEFLDDGETDEGNVEDGMWELVGGEHLVGPGSLPFQITDIAKTGANVTITWQSSEGAGYTIERATAEQLASGQFDELEDGFEGAEGDTTSYTDEGFEGSEAYYRVRSE